MDENKPKKEYSVSSKNYNQSISSPNYEVKNKFRINMESIDSVNLSKLKRKTSERIKQETETKPEEKVPDINEIYGNKASEKSTTEIDKKEKKAAKTSVINNNSILNKIPPEKLIALVTCALIIAFMIISVVIYNLMVNYL